MFDQIKLEVGAVLIIIVLCIGGYFVWKYNHAINQDVVDKAANKELTTANATDNATIAAVQKSDTITDATNVAVTQQTVATENTTAAITASVNNKIAAIKQSYSNQSKAKPPVVPPSPGTTQMVVVDPAAAEDKAIAQTLINGLWQMYCAGESTVPACAKPPPASTP